MLVIEDVEADIVRWINTFVAVPNAFYDGKFAPCPYARGAMAARSVDVAAWEAGDVRPFIRQKVIDLAESRTVGTRVLAFPPRVQWLLGLSEYIETLNMEFISKDLFLNTGVAKTSISRYPGSQNEPYFIIVVNSLDAVLRAARSLEKSEFYKKWPKQHYDLVVQRRRIMAKRFSARGNDK